MARAKKDEQVQYRNETQGFLGARKFNRKGDEVQVSVRAGEDVWLTEEEKQLTIRAHRKPEGNPFVEREIIVYDLQTHEVTGQKVTAPLTPVQDTGAAQAPAGTATEGSYGADEEVGTPDAPRRTRSRRQTAGAR